MKKATIRCVKRGGFTLIEVLISAFISSILLAGFMMGMTALQRSFTATQFYATAQSDETRVLDYINRDVRRALTVSASGSTLTVTVPDYINSATGQPRIPTISSGSIIYTNSSITITYVLTGSQVRRTEAGGTPLLIASNVASFTPVVDPSDSTGKTVNATLTFTPKYQTSVSSIATADTTVACKVVKRN